MNHTLRTALISAFLLTISAPAFAASNGSTGGLWTAAVRYNTTAVDPYTGMPLGTAVAVIQASSQAACQAQVDGWMSNSYSQPVVIRPCQQGMVNMDPKVVR